MATVEDAIRSVFREAIGASTLKEAPTLNDGVTFNKHKDVFQACVKLQGQCFVKEFKAKDDAQHWVDILHSLDKKKLLQGHYSTLKQAAANRKATQDAYEKILNSKQVLKPEDSAAFQKDHADGKDIWADMWTKYVHPTATLPSSSVSLPRNCMDKMIECGFSEPIYGELLGWKHKQLGWRAVEISTHPGDCELHAANRAAELKLSHVGFIRCTAQLGEPNFTAEDKEKLKNIAGKTGVGLAVIVGYPVKIGQARAWQCTQDLDASSSSSSAKPMAFQEVEVSFISRRVEGEHFLVRSVVPKQSNQTDFKAQIEQTFQKHLDKHLNKPAPVDLKRFKRVPVLADGFCFWHCFLRISSSEYQSISRSSNGAPRSHERLKKEIDMSKTVRVEFIDMYSNPETGLPFSEEDRKMMEAIAQSPQVTLRTAHWICCKLGICIRISVSPEAPSMLWVGIVF